MQKRQAGVEVTPEMIQAGVDELMSYSEEDMRFTEKAVVVDGIFRAMSRARQKRDAQESPHL